MKNKQITNKVKGTIFIMVFSLLLLFCKKEKVIQSHSIWGSEINLPQEPYNYSNPSLPNFFANQFIQKSDNTPVDNPTTNWGATLGRVLFYDKKLSVNNTISCSSCHIQKFGFSDTAKLSKGFNGGSTKRHSMGLTNAMFYFEKKFFWDERANTLEDQVLMPIQDPVEMGMQLDSLVQKLKNIDYYPGLFYKAFGSNVIDSTKIARALAQFVRSMVSYRSPFDEGMSLVMDRLDDFPNFDSSENRGKRIFFKPATINCSGCHTTEVFIGDVARNNGISFTNMDYGVGGISGNTLDNFTFKTPSLKNIALRPPYMHDGRFSSLEQVIDHYSSGITNSTNLDPHFRIAGGGVFQFNFTIQEKIDLIAFLKTLTDKKMIEDEKFSSPFLID